jgi:hypothetical protein
MVRHASDIIVIVILIIGIIPYRATGTGRFISATGRFISATGSLLLRLRFITLGLIQKGGLGKFN